MNEVFDRFTTISLGIMICGTISWGVYFNHLNTVDGNEREEKIQTIRVNNQHEIEVTKQKSITEDKGRKRKIWERAMPTDSEEEQ